MNTDYWRCQAHNNVLGYLPSGAKEPCQKCVEAARKAMGDKPKNETRIKPGQRCVIEEGTGAGLVVWVVSVALPMVMVCTSDPSFKCARTFSKHVWCLRVIKEQ